MEQLLGCGYRQLGAQCSGIAFGVPRWILQGIRAAPRPEHVPVTLVFHSIAAVDRQVTQAPHTHPTCRSWCVAGTRGKRRKHLLAEDNEQILLPCPGHQMPEGQSPLTLVTVPSPAVGTAIAAVVPEECQQHANPPTSCTSSFLGGSAGLHGHWPGLLGPGGCTCPPPHSPRH